MPELTLAEQLLYSTVKLSAYRAGVPVSTGTGFFMNFAVEGPRMVPTIVTNKHVVRGCDQVTAVCHFEENNKPSGRYVSCNMPIASGLFIEHPDPNVDLCAIPIASILQQTQDAGRRFSSGQLGSISSRKRRIGSSSTRSKKSR